MEITKFKINDERTAIDLTIENSSNLSKIYIFDNESYKDYNEALDITNKAQNTSTENITITLSDLQIGEFDGLYFVEVKTSDGKNYNDTLLDSTKYDECILDKILKSTNCDSCLKNISNSVINSFNMLQALKIAEEKGFLQEALNIINSLDNYCSNKCKTCGPYNNIKDDNYFEYNEEEN